MAKAKKVQNIECNTPINEIRAEICINPIAHSTEAVLALRGEKHVGYTDIVKAIAGQIDKLRLKDTKNMENILYAQTITLDAVFTYAIGKFTQSNHLNQAQVFAQIAMKSQNQCRTTLATLNDMINPRNAVFVKQQNNAVNQQINNNTSSSKKLRKSENFENKANELLSETNNEAVDTRRAITSISVNPEMATMEDGRC